MFVYEVFDWEMCEYDFVVSEIYWYGGVWIDLVDFRCEDCFFVDVAAIVVYVSFVVVYVLFIVVYVLFIVVGCVCGWMIFYINVLMLCCFVVLCVLGYFLFVERLVRRYRFFFRVVK